VVQPIEADFVGAMGAIAPTAKHPWGRRTDCLPHNTPRYLDHVITKKSQKHQKLFGEMTDTKKVPASDAFVGGIKIRPLTQIS